MTIYPLTIKFKFAANDKLKKVATKLARLSPEAIASIVKFAMRRTLLEGIRQRYAARGESILFTDRAPKVTTHDFNSLSHRRRLMSVSRKIAAARLEQDFGKVAKFQKHQTEILKDFAAGGKRLPTGRTISSVFGHNKGKSGRVLRALEAATLRKRSAQRAVMEHFIGADPFMVTTTEDTLTVGVGYIPALDIIETPSATDELSGHPSSSPFKKLWLQMEYGAGIYATPSPAFTGTKFKTGVGSWWYGRHMGSGIHLLGQKPGNILRERTGAPYIGEGRLFQQVFAQQMKALIFGD